MKPQIRSRAPSPSNIVFSTEARGTAEFARSGYQTPAEIAETAAIMATALSQPHRRPLSGHEGSGGYEAAKNDDRRLESVLGRFCANHKPRPLGDHCYQAGIRYAEIVREYKNAMGFDVPGWGPSDNGYLTMTPAQIAARKELAIMRKRGADEVLLALMPRLPRVMEKLCFDELEPSPYDEALIIDGLVLLARKFGTEPKNIRDEMKND
jgi:hypothetical protein